MSLFSTVFLAVGCNKLYYKQLITFLVRYAGVLGSMAIQNSTSENHLLGFLLFLLLFITSLIKPALKLPFTFLSCASEYSVVSLQNATEKNVSAWVSPNLHQNPLVYHYKKWIAVNLDIPLRMPAVTEMYKHNCYRVDLIFGTNLLYFCFTLIKNLGSRYFHVVHTVH